MRKLLALAICVGVGGCYWVPKKTAPRGTNYDPPADHTSPYGSKRL